MNQLTNIHLEGLWIVAVTLLLYLLYKYSTWNFDYWKERGVPYVNPLPLIGNSWKLIAMQAQISHFLSDFYSQFSTPYVGIYIFNKPHLIVRCPQLIKSILVQDFHNFSDRTIDVREENDSIASNVLFTMKNPNWKSTRSKISPVFSTKKLKDMIPLMNQVAKEMRTYLENNFNKSSIDVKEFCAKFATDIIASCAFGIDAKSFHSEDAEFRKIGRLVFDFRLKTALSQSFYFLAPNIMTSLRLPFFDERFTSFMRNVFWETYSDRTKTNKKRNDLIDIIMQMKDGTGSQEFKLEGDRLVAQAVQFFTAGFEAVSSAMSFALYELCLHEEIQQKVRHEVQDCLSKHGELSYESLKGMTYLEMVLLETLRKYPGLSFLDRICHEDYQVPNSNLVIEKGTPIYISMLGLHYDNAYFPEPQKFIPERFSPENKDSFPEYAYMPFGKGPRVCIGERFGLTVCKLGLAQVLSEFKVERNDETPVPVDYETKGFLLSSKAGLPMKFTKFNLIVV